MTIIVSLLYAVLLLVEYTSPHAVYPHLPISARLITAAQLCAVAALFFAGCRNWAYAKAPYLHQQLLELIKERQAEIAKHVAALQALRDELASREGSKLDRCLDVLDKVVTNAVPIAGFGLQA